MKNGDKITKYAGMLFFVSLLYCCEPQAQTYDGEGLAGVTADPTPPIPGSYAVDSLAQALGQSVVGVVANHTSLVAGTHLVDTLRALGVRVKRIFAPEHGFRGDRPDGSAVQGGVDTRTGIPVVSLYGKRKKPTPQHLSDLDVVIFDIQDVGARFYTYLSTLHYVMEACAENGRKLIVLDRPNPNGFYIDGPVLDTAFRSFVGMHPIPVVYGLTLGEMTGMINGEGWLAGDLSCDVQVVPCKNYTHATPYSLPVPPSPNLRSAAAIYLYPSLCFFEGTTVSVGRGTSNPFTLIGAPGRKVGDTTFVPRSIPAVSEHPPHLGDTCIGYNLKPLGQSWPQPDTLRLSWLLHMYATSPQPEHFFLSSGFFDLLAGSDALRRDLVAGATLEEIRQSWEPALTAYKELRSKYVIYPDTQPQH